MKRKYILIFVLIAILFYLLQSGVRILLVMNKLIKMQRAKEWEVLGNTITTKTDWIALDYQSELKEYKVPRVIHQLWKNEEIPKKWEKSYDSWNMYSNGSCSKEKWERILWTDKKAIDFLENNYPWFMDTFNSFGRKIQKVDALKYFIIYHFGGIYADMDITVDRCGLDEIMKRCNVTLLGTNPIGFAADFLISSPKHPYFERMINNLRPASTFYGLPLPYLAILFSTGPIYVALQYNDFQDKKEICAIMPELHEESTGSPLTFLSEVEGNSWYEWDALLIYYIKRHKKFILFFICIIAIYFLYKKTNFNQIRPLKIF